MKKRKIGFNYRGKKFELGVELCNEIEKLRGLMFRSRKNAPTLLFEFKKQKGVSIHSWFVFFPFVSLFLDDKNKIVEKRFVKPFEFNVKPKVRYTRLIEIPISSKYFRILEFLDGAKGLNSLML